MSYTRPTQSVIAFHFQLADEWGLAVVASRSQNGQRTITPAVFATAQSSTFQACPWRTMATQAIASTGIDNHNVRKELLKNCLESFVVHTRERGHEILAVAETGLWNTLMHKPYKQIFEAFLINHDPLFDWLLASRQSGHAVRCLELMSHLAKKHLILERTQQELEDAGMEYLKTNNHIPRKKDN